MKSSLYPLCWIVVIGMLTSTSPARADLIPWMYSWSRSPQDIPADAPGTGYISLTEEPLRYAVGNSDIVATNLQTHSTASVSNKDIFTNKPYSLTLFLLDLESGESGTLTFTGHINGWLTASSSYLRNTFTGDITQSIVLGNSRYTATMNGYTPPGPPGAINSGSISAKAAITIESIVQVPEPGSLTLSGVGMLALGIVRWRSRRRASRQQQRGVE